MDHFCAIGATISCDAPCSAIRPPDLPKKGGTPSLAEPLKCGRAFCWWVSGGIAAIVCETPQHILRQWSCVRVSRDGGVGWATKLRPDVLRQMLADNPLKLSVCEVHRTGW